MQTARPEQRKVVGGIMFSAALCAFLTGVTEPLEYSFIYVAWPLLLIHAVLTGTSMALVNALDIHSGFGFSAGAIDFVLNFGISRHAVWLIPIGLAYAALYYVLFRFAITRWNLSTPGREEPEGAGGPDGTSTDGTSTSGTGGSASGGSGPSNTSG